MFASELGKGSFQFQNEDGNPRQVTNILRHNPTFLRTFNNQIVNKVVKEVISLPMHTELTFDQIEYISNKIIEFLNK